jgi:hypothetical protein
MTSRPRRAAGRPRRRDARRRPRPPGPSCPRCRRSPSGARPRWARSWLAPRF